MMKKASLRRVCDENIFIVGILRALGKGAAAMVSSVTEKRGRI
ncbi:hypothetical protein [Selenomonas sp.]|nr:hypothetical protein [Selenomonas sp.]